MFEAVFDAAVLTTVLAAAPRAAVAGAGPVLRCCGAADFGLAVRRERGAGAAAAVAELAVVVSSAGAAEADAE